MEGNANIGTLNVRPENIPCDQYVTKSAQFLGFEPVVMAPKNWTTG